MIELAGVEEDFGYFLYGDIGKLVAALRLELCAAYQQGFIFAQPAMNGFKHPDGYQPGGGEYEIMFGTTSLLPIKFFIG